MNDYESHGGKDKEFLSREEIANDEKDGNLNHMRKGEDAFIGGLLVNLFYGGKFLYFFYSFNVQLIISFASFINTQKY